MAARIALFVLGMHRSGTSALARVLNLLGAKLPEDLLGANKFNPTGYWEPRAVIDQNEAFLAELGASWDAPAFDRADIGPRREDMVKAAAEVLASAYGDAELIVVKDPRCTLFADIWADAAERAGYQPRLVAISRSVDAVAQSLSRRDAMTPDEAGALWCWYGACTLEALDNHGGALLDYGAMTTNWRGEIARVTALNGAELSVSDRMIEAEIDGFLSPAGEAGPADYAPRITGWIESVQTAYETQRAGGEPARLDALTAQMAEYGVLAARAVARNKAAASRRLQEVEAERDEARQSQADSETRARAGAKLITSLEAERNEARQRLAERTAALEAERNEARQRLTERTAALEAERDEARSAQADAEQRAAAGAEVIRSLEAERETERAEHKRLDRDFKALEASVAAFSDEAERAGGELKRTQADYASADAERVALRIERERLTHRLDVIEASAYWRAGEGVRRLAQRAPWFATPIRRALKLVWWTATGQLFTRLRARSNPAEANNAGGDAPHAPLVAAPAGGDPFSGLAPVLAAEFGEDAARAAREWITHYDLDFQSDGRPPIQKEIDAETARRWAERLARRAPVRDEAEPDVSIIIPAYNQIAYTLACLESVLALQTGLSFEVLIGDDRSSDGTEAASVVAISGVRWIRHDENQGFVGNCNATARQARGRHVVFLNNDTLVLPGWLDALIDTLQADQSVGLTGSKLIYPDGRLQEAGGIFWRDGSAWNYGRFDDPRRPQYAYAREADYISGASIALPRALWEKLGGFDEHFRPAYAEDADLAFRVRAEGLRTVYQPRSQLIHFEGVTSGTDLGSGAKAHQVENLKRLHARWGDALAAHRQNGVEPELEKERGVARRALFIDLTTPEPAHDAGSVVAVECMRALQHAGFKVTFVPQDNFLWTRDFTAPLQAMGVEAVYHPYESRFSSFIEKRGAEFDLVFVHRFETAERVLADLRAHASQARVALLNADLHYLREAREAELSGDPAMRAAAEQTRQRELAVMRAADLVLTHSTAERDILADALPGEPVMHLPLIHDPEPTPADFAERAGIGFIGGFGHPPNADAVDWFLTAVWPKVRAALPDARFVLAGSKMPDRYTALDGKDGIEVLGFVERLEDFFNRVRLTVAPLRFGAGAKGKVAASLAMAAPCVATPIAAEGMGLEAGRDIAVAESAEALAEALVELYSDEARWRAMREAGLKFAEAQTSRAVVRRRMNEMLSALGLDAEPNVMKHHVS
ncbi:MAG: glycosyltransferase [Pseudomonadota bacterium]